MATTYPVTYAAHQTLATTTVDTIQIARWVTSVEIVNRSGGNALYVTWTSGIVAPTAVTDPVGGASNTDVVPSGQTISIDVPAGPVTVKVVGSANDYSVVGRGN